MESKDEQEDPVIVSEKLEDEEEVENTSRRFYECVFCKRGFSTAQALGGHMNIHRKDRSKATKPVQEESKDPPLYSVAAMSQIQYPTTSCVEEDPKGSSLKMRSKFEDERRVDGLDLELRLGNDPQ